MGDRDRAIRMLLWIGMNGCLAATAIAQTAPALTTQFAIIQAEEHGATAPRDLAVIRSGTHSENGQTVRMAVRAPGRTERPAQNYGILPLLKHPLSAGRIEAAKANAQAP